MDIIRQLDACYLFFIVERIFTYLDLLSRMQLGCVCKTWRRIFHSVKLQRIMKVRQQNEPALFSNFAVLKRILPSHESFRLDDEHVRCCAMNGQWMAAGCQSGRIPVWSRQTLRRWLVLSVDNDKPVTSLYADDRVLIAGFQGGLVAIWNVKTFHLLQLIASGDASVYDNVTVLCNGRHVVAYLRVSASWKTLRGCLHIYDMDDGSTVKTATKKTIRFYREVVYRLRFDDKYLVCVYQPIGARGCQVSIRSASSFQSLTHTFDGIGTEELGGLFDYCHGWIVRQSVDQQTVHLWSIDTGHHQIIRHAGDIIYSVGCNDSGQILTKSLDTCRVWQVSPCAGQLKLLFSLQGSHDVELFHKFDLFDGRQLVSIVRKSSTRVAVLQLNCDSCWGK